MKNCSKMCLVSLWAPHCIVLYCDRFPAANAPGCTAAEGLLYKPWSLVFPTCTARCLHQKNGRWILPENARITHNIQGSFTCRKSTWDKRLYFPSEGRRAEEFFAPPQTIVIWRGAVCSDCLNDHLLLTVLHTVGSLYSAVWGFRFRGDRP